MAKEKWYYFIDIDLSSRRIIGWGTEERDEVEVKLSPGFHRLFVSKGQFNKLIREMDA